VHLARAAGLEPDPWQADYLRAGEDCILNCSRQSGKSTMTGIKATHKAAYSPRSTTLLTAAAQRQAAELMLKVKDVFRAVSFLPSIVAEAQHHLILANGSRILALPGKEGTIRCYTADLLILDESARIPDGTYMSVRPMLAVSGGQVCLLSTPFGKRGFFHDEWHKGQNWRKFRIPAELCPRITAEFLAAERAKSEWWYRQEYCCEFVEDQYAFFNPDSIAAAFAGDLPEYLTLTGRDEPLVPGSIIDNTIPQLELS